MQDLRDVAVSIYPSSLRRPALVAALATAVLAASAAAPVAMAAERWEMPLAYSATNYHARNALSFTRCIGEKTNGELEIVTHPGGSLIKGSAIKAAVQSGKVAIGESLLSDHVDENPLFGIDSVPFLAVSFDDSERLSKAIRVKLSAALEAQNLRYLYSVPWPPQGLYFKRRISSIADMKGLRFRTYNEATRRLAELAGMQPVQIEAADLSRALATDQADALASSSSTGFDRKIWEQMTDFYDVQAWLPRNTVIVNRDAFAALDPAARQAIVQCAGQAATSGLEQAREMSNFYLKALASKGINVRQPDAKFARELARLGKTMSAEWQRSAGPEGQQVLEAFANP